MRLKSSEDVAICISDKGYLVIRQDDFLGREQMLLLSPEQAAMLGGFIRDSLTAMAKAWAAGLDEEE